MASWWTAEDMLDSLDVEENSIVSRVIQAVGLFGDFLSIEDTMEPMLAQSERVDQVGKGFHISEEDGMVGHDLDATDMQDKAVVVGDISAEEENEGKEKGRVHPQKEERKKGEEMEQRIEEEKERLDELKEEEVHHKGQNKGEEDRRDNDKEEIMMKTRVKDSCSEEIENMQEDKSLKDYETETQLNEEKETGDDKVVGTDDAENHVMGIKCEDLMDQSEEETEEGKIDGQHEKLEKKRDEQNQYQKCYEKVEQGLKEETEDVEQERQEILEILDNTILHKNSDVEEERTTEEDRQEKQEEINENTEDEVEENVGMIEKNIHINKEKLNGEEKEMTDNGEKGEKEEVVSEKIKKNEEQAAAGKKKEINPKDKEMKEKETYEEEGGGEEGCAEEEDEDQMEETEEGIDLSNEDTVQLASEVQSEIVAEGAWEEKHPTVPEHSTKVKDKKNRSLNLPPSKYKTVSYRRIRRGNTKQRIDEYEAMINI